MFMFIVFVGFIFVVVVTVWGIVVYVFVVVIFFWFYVGRVSIFLGFRVKRFLFGEVSICFIAMVVVLG